MKDFLPNWLVDLFQVQSLHAWEGILLSGVFSAAAFLTFYYSDKPNRWIGVRLPWTFADQEIWEKINKAAAILLLLTALFASLGWIFFVLLALLTVIASIFGARNIYQKKYGTLRYCKGPGSMDYRPVACCAKCGHLQNLDSAASLAGARCDSCSAFLRPLESS